NLEVPKSWLPSLDIVRFKDLSITENQSDLVGDNDSDRRSYVENAQVSESLQLMKFYSLSSDVVNHLLSDHEGRELDLPFEPTDQEMEIILYRKSSFIVGRSGTGKTTVLTKKLFQNEQRYQLAVQGCVSCQNSMVEQSTSATKGTLHQLFVTVSPKLCFAIKQHVLNLKSFACGGSDSTEKSLIHMADFDEGEAQFKDIKDSFHDIPPNSYPLVITFHKFLMMLDGTLGNSYFERFLDARKLTHGQLQSSRSVALQTFIRTKEVKYERFSSSYWPHFNIQLTKMLEASRVFTEIISHIKGGLEAMEAGDGKLNRENYVRLSESRGSNLSKQKREAIYDIFQAYEKMKMKNGEFDLGDFVIDLHHRLRHEKYGGDQMDFVYIDEVQDLTMSQIALFKHMCINIEEGFIFSGDTAQTIARGIDFRFQDIRHLFHKKFVLESRSNKLEERKEKGQISKMFHLTQNFRTHAGILKLSQSIIELIYRFFPHSIDVLDPETSLIYGEAPVLLESGENENAIIKIFGNSATGTGIVGFGAEQVILVRDDGARKDVSMFVGKHALVLTIVECKGLEFQDVLLYNFFGSSPLKNQWRVIYDYMKERDLLDSTLPKGFPSFNEARHNILCSELKQLYVAVTRTRQRLWVCENVEELSKPMFDYWKKKCLVQVRQLDDSLAQAMQVASSPEEWKSRGIKLYHEHNYEMATMCFERGGDTYWERRSKAAGLRAIADRMRTSNPEEANSVLREAAEIFDAIGKADSAARCFSDLGEYERAARIYLDKCGVPDLERAGECFSLAGCYKDAADVYARGNYFFECLTVCSKGKLFQMGLQYIKYWKQHAIEDGVVARRGEGIDKIEQEYLESCASHYYELKDNRSMMNFVKAFHSIILMRNFLKKLGLLDELLLLEEEFGNYLEAADIAKLKGDILLEAGFLGKAGKFREASLHILFYVLANSLWSHGRKGWPIQQFSQKEELLSKAKSFAKNETESFYELVCTEVDILLNEQSNLALIKNYMNVCQRHKSTRGELLSARKILDAHISSSANKYVWEKDLVDGDLIMCSEGRISENQVSIDSLIYFWIFWKDKIAFITEYIGCLENQDANDYRRYGELCLDYLGVWRLYHNLTPVYVLLISDADWVRGLDKRHFRNHGKLVSISVHQLVSAARSYWSSEMLSVGMKVLEKLENLYKFPIKNADDAVFCQSRCLTHICEISEYLLQSKCLKLRNQDTERLQRCVKFSTDTVVANIFPLDWRNSLRENMIALRRTDALKNVLKQVIVEYTSSKEVLSFGQIGRLAMVILGSGKLNNSELYEKLVVKLDCHQPWKAFIENLCGNIGPGNTSEEPREVSIMLKLYGALVDTYNANWRVVRDYISPGCFLYLVERLLIWATCFQGYAITTSSCFVEWLIYQQEDTDLSSIVGGDVQQSLIDILHFVIYMVQGCLFNKADMVEWIKKTDANWKNNYSQLMLRFVVVLCLVYLNFGMGLDELYDLLGRDYITEQLPWEFFDALKSGRRHKSLNINTRLLAAAFQKIGNTLVIASFGSDCSRFLCSDVLFVDMKANHSRDYILRKLFPKRPPVLQVSQATSVEAGGNNSCSRVLHATNSNYEEGKSSKILPSNSGVVEPFETGAVSDKTSDDCARGRDSHNTDEESCISKESNPKSKQADAVASGSNETGNKGKKRGKNKKPKKKGGKK
ncbi:PREDICTED: TPR and ankyrin repeat-containing, partial [Prunus dulcis]